MRGSNVTITFQSDGLCPFGEGLQLLNVLFMAWMLEQNALLANLQVTWKWARIVLSRGHWRRSILLFSATFWKVIERTKNNCAGIGQTKHHQVGTFDYIKEKSPTFTLKVVQYWKSLPREFVDFVISNIQNRTKNSGQADLAVRSLSRRLTCETSRGPFQQKLFFWFYSICCHLNLCV